MILYRINLIIHTVYILLYLFNFTLSLFFPFIIKSTVIRDIEIRALSEFKRKRGAGENVRNVQSRNRVSHKLRSKRRENRSKL